MPTYQCIDLSEENSKILDDLRYFAENCLPEKRPSFEASLKSFAASLISTESVPFSPPAQKPASVPGGSGAGLVGNPPEVCKFCGAPSWVDPSDQVFPAAYCHESDHGSPDLILDFCDTLPATMTGDAWESAARYVLSMRGQS